MFHLWVEGGGLNHLNHLLVAQKEGAPESNLGFLRKEVHSLE